MNKDEAIQHVLVLKITNHIMQHYPEFERQQVREFTYGALHVLEASLRQAHDIDITGPPDGTVGIELWSRVQ